MKMVSFDEWTQRAKEHEESVSPNADDFLYRRGLGIKHPVYDFMYTYYSFSPGKLKKWVPSFEEAIEVGTKVPKRFNLYWFEHNQGVLRLNRERLQGPSLAMVSFVEELCRKILERAPRLGCYGLHEWAMVYRLSEQELRHQGYPLRISPEELARFVESQNLCCTHYDAYRFFTPQAERLNLFRPTLETRMDNEQPGCIHANMDVYKWSTKLWPWVGSDLIRRAYFIALEGREIDMRASPYDLESVGLSPIRIETESGRRDYQQLQQQYAQKAQGFRRELLSFCTRLKNWAVNESSSIEWCQH